MGLRNPLVFLCLCSFVLPASAQAPLADRLPAGALLYAGWAGRSLAFDGSLAGQMLNDPTVARICSQLKALMGETLGGKRADVFNHAWPMAAIAWEHPIAVSLADLAVSQTGPALTGTLLIDLGKDRQAFAEHLDALIQSLLTAESVSENSVGQVTYKVVKNPFGLGDLCLGFMGDLFFAALGQTVPKQLAELTPQNALPTDKKFRDCYQAVSGENELWVFYVDVSAALDRLERPVASSQPSAAEQGESLSGSRKTLKALGLGKMTAVAITTRIVDRGMYTKTRLFTPGPHTGVLMPLAGEPLADADLSIVPEDADLAIAARISPEALYGELLDCLHELSDGASVNYGRDFLRELTRIETDLGLSIKDDLLASLGDTVVVSSAPSQGGFLTGTLLSISVRDSAKLSAAIDKMESFLKTKLPGGSARADRCACSTRPQQPQDEPSSCPECGRNRMPVDRRDSIGIESIEVARTDVHYITGSAGFPWPIAPAWAVHKDRLYLAGWPQVIASAIEREALGPLTAETGFLGTRTKVSRNASVLCYANTPKVLRQAYNWLLLGWTAGANYMAGQTSVGVRPDWLPALSTLEKYTRPDITVVLADQEGITIESYGSLPGTGVTFAPLPSPLTVGVLLPSLNYARRKAKRAISKDNLHTIGMAISLYVSENADQWPPDLASLVADDGHPIEGQSFRMLACETLVSPLSGRQVPQLVGGKLSGEIDYMYTPLDARAPGNLVAAYERPENYSGKGTLVLFADSHVAWLDMPEFQKAMVRTRKSLETKAAKLESEAF